LRRLSHDFPREAQKLTAATLTILLAVAGSCSAIAADSAAVARGARLAAAAGCGQCHTDSKHGGRPYAGGRALETRFGTIATPNIIPDRQTGIGRWSVNDFIKAMRWGVAPDATHYLPVFPFLYYNRLTSRDLADLKAFLDSVRSVSQANRAGDPMPFAFARAAVAVLTSRFPGPWRPDQARDAMWNRGAYLVATVGRCGDCHTPRNWLGAPDARRPFAGSAGGGDAHAAPNITPDPESGIGRWSESDIINLLTDGQKPDFDFVGGAMGEIVSNTAQLDDADRRAIAVYLKSVPPIRSREKD
jgi:mono/diheme cytochrome c family protein